MAKMSIFPKAYPIFLIFLWMGGGGGGGILFISVTYCILNLTNYFKDDWYWP